MRATAIRALIPLAIVAAHIGGCRGEEPDAYGNFEATEVVVSAEAAGRLVSFAAAEGVHLPAGVAVGQIDTTALALQRRELELQRGAARTRTTEADAQIAVLRAQLATAEDEHRRTLRLFRAEAATARQLSQAEGEVRVLRQRIEAARAQTGVVEQESGGAEARLAQIEDRIRRSRITNPVAGTVVASYAEAGEWVQPGQPLYRVAELDTLTLRAYVAGSQLASVRLGQPVSVRIDAPDGEMEVLPGRVRWIAPEAEFTPTPVQTRDERTAQVYAVKIRVPNPAGRAKIGMPAEVIFDAPAARAPS